MADLPSSVLYGTVVGQFIQAVADTPDDANREPDSLPMVGRIIFEPSVSRIKLDDPTLDNPVTVFPRTVIVTLDSQGYIVGPDGLQGVKLVASDNPGDPSNFTYVVRMEFEDLPNITVPILVPANVVTDLSTTIPVPANPGDEIAAWNAIVSRVQQLAQDAQRAASDYLASQPGVVAAAASAVSTEIATRDLVEKKSYLPVGDVSAGFLGENGRPTDLVVNETGEIPDLIFLKWISRIVNHGDFVTGALDSPYFPGGGFVGENGRATDLVVDENGDVLSSVIARWADRMRAARGFVTGGESRIYSGFAGENGRATELIVDALGNVPKDVLNRWASRMTLPPAGVDLSQVYSGPDILTVGDSLTASGNIASKLATLTGRTVRNMGVGGEGTGTIMGRLGVWPMMVSISGGVLPASGAVDVSLVSSYNGVAVAPNLQGTGVRGEADTYLWGTLGVGGPRVRIDMRINDDGPPQVRQWQITRDGTGNAITYLRPQPFIPEHGSARSGDIIILWTGQNDGSDTARSYAAFQALEQWMTKAGKRFLIASKPTGANTGWTDFEKSLLDRWGRRYLNIRRFLIDDAMPLMNLTPTSQDELDIQSGTVPTSLRSDSTHHTAAAQQAMAEFLHYPRLKELRFV